MFKRLLKPVISSNQLIQNVPARTCDNIKWFSLSSVHSKVNKKAFGLRPPANPYSQYFKVVFPRQRRYSIELKTSNISWEI